MAETVGQYVSRVLTSGEQKPRVIPATREMLAMWTLAELRDYAESVGNVGHRNWAVKRYWIDWLLEHGATICATLGD